MEGGLLDRERGRTRLWRLERKERTWKTPNNNNRKVLDGGTRSKDQGHRRSCTFHLNKQRERGRDPGTSKTPWNLSGFANINTINILMNSRASPSLTTTSVDDSDT